ncbi:hypothetical protein DPEC_G00097960 [Dallia pectoralis]|uniref:Uncharacterized protein n=1 Tax=Dallia pectoralis TaxID=75939 RepID=A0ACC2GVW3_DALPE|nr:hypothetical protein DPEC_G00097960 [Dallia pectoralis]
MNTFTGPVEPDHPVKWSQVNGVCNHAWRKDAFDSWRPCDAPQFNSVAVNEKARFSSLHPSCLAVANEKLFSIVLPSWRYAGLSRMWDHWSLPLIQELSVWLKLCLLSWEFLGCRVLQRRTVSSANTLG